MKPVRVVEKHGALALEMTDAARRYAAETEREAQRWAQKRRDRSAFRFLRFLRDGGAR